MPVNLDDIRKRREERRQAMLAAVQEEQPTNGKQPATAVAEKSEESTPEPTPPMERRRRTTRDEAVAERQASKSEPAADKEPENEEDLVDTVSVDGKEMAVYETPKPEVLEAVGIDEALISRVVAEVRKTVQEEFSRLHIRFGIDGQNQVQGLAEEALQSLMKNQTERFKKQEAPAKQSRRSRQPESEGYKKFKAEWRSKSEDERVAYAKQVGAKWVAHPDAKIDAMRMQMAVRDAIGVEKYD